MSAKLAWHALLAGLIATAGSVIALGAGTAYLASQGAGNGASGGEILLTVAGVVAVTTAYAAIAAALGLVVRNQTTVITGALVWMLAIENVVPLLLHAPGLRRWLLDGSADRILHLVRPDPAMHSAWFALLTFAAVFAGLAVTATVRFERSDIP